MIDKISMKVMSVINNFFFFKQKTAYEMRISDWSSDVCSSDLQRKEGAERRSEEAGRVRFAVIEKRHAPPAGPPARRHAPLRAVLRRPQLRRDRKSVV